DHLGRELFVLGQRANQPRDLGHVGGFRFANHRAVLDCRAGGAMKKVLLAILAILVAVPVVVGLIGFLQADPQDVTVSAHIKQPPEAVFGVLADFATWPTWNSALSNARKGTPQDNRDVWQMDSSFGTLTNEVVELTPPTKIVT